MGAILDSLAVEAVLSGPIETKCLSKSMLDL